MTEKPKPTDAEMSDILLELERLGLDGMPETDEIQGNDEMFDAFRALLDRIRKLEDDLRVAGVQPW